MRNLLYFPVMLVLSLFYGIVNIHQSEQEPFHLFAVIPMSLMGFFYPRLFWVSAYLYTVGLYAVHLYAIESLHYQPPYVERDAATALHCFTDIVPCLMSSGFGAILSVGIRFAVKQYNQRR